MQLLIIARVSEILEDLWTVGALRDFLPDPAVPFEFQCASESSLILDVILAKLKSKRVEK
jgi:hypothetical protein